MSRLARTAGDPRCDCDEHRAVDEGGEDLEPLQPVGTLRGGWPLGHARHEHRQPEGRHVGKHVPGISEQRQGMG